MKRINKYEYLFKDLTLEAQIALVAKKILDLKPGDEIINVYQEFGDWNIVYLQNGKVKQFNLTKFLKEIESFKNKYINELDIDIKCCYHMSWDNMVKKEIDFSELASFEVDNLEFDCKEYGYQECKECNGYFKLEGEK